MTDTDSSHNSCGKSFVVVYAATRVWCSFGLRRWITYWPMFVLCTILVVRLLLLFMRTLSFAKSFVDDYAATCVWWSFCADDLIIDRCWFLHNSCGKSFVVYAATRVWFSFCLRRWISYWPLLILYIVLCKAFCWWQCNNTCVMQFLFASMDSLLSDVDSLHDSEELCK